MLTEDMALTYSDPNSCFIHGDQTGKQPVAKNWSYYKKNWVTGHPSKSEAVWNDLDHLPPSRHHLVARPDLAMTAAVRILKRAEQEEVLAIQERQRVQARRQERLNALRRRHVGQHIAMQQLGVGPRYSYDFGELLFQQAHAAHAAREAQQQGAMAHDDEHGFADGSSSDVSAQMSYEAYAGSPSEQSAHAASTHASGASFSGGHTFGGHAAGAVRPHSMGSSRSMASLRGSMSCAELRKPPSATQVQGMQGLLLPRYPPKPEPQVEWDVVLRPRPTSSAMASVNARTQHGRGRAGASQLSSTRSLHTQSDSTLVGREGLGSAFSTRQHNRPSKTLPLQEQRRAAPQIPIMAFK
mmetsp:Transcript_28430/g.62240  ORF Transcript_28430/g.62240 Transcript_28430/m.62240 type:complete len:354 (+) Transcript_28430:176-1237(+)